MYGHLASCRTINNYIFSTFINQLISTLFCPLKYTAQQRLRRFAWFLLQSLSDFIHTVCIIWDWTYYLPQYPLIPELKTYCLEINSFILIMHYLDHRKDWTQVGSSRIVCSHLGHCARCHFGSSIYQYTLNKF